RRRRARRWAEIWVAKSRMWSRRRRRRWPVWVAGTPARGVGAVGVVVARQFEQSRQEFWTAAPTRFGDAPTTTRCLVTPTPRNVGNDIGEPPGVVLVPANGARLPRRHCQIRDLSPVSHISIKPHISPEMPFNWWRQAKQHTVSGV